jgi:glycolate oxidase FAD binding subunit
MSDAVSAGPALRGTALSDAAVSAVLDVVEGVFPGGPPDPPREGEAPIQDAVRAAYAAREPLLIHGGNTKAAMLRPVQAARTLSLAGHTGVTLYAPKELVFAARAGTAMAEVDAVLAEAGQHMIAEPPDYSRLLGAEPGARQTLGGVVSANLSGPRRVAWGAVRDHVLGVRAVNGAGEIIRSGGRVLKNVTGLDICKLLTGAHGTLGVLMEITVKVLPAPEDSASVVVRGLAPAEAVIVLSAALGSPFGVSGAAYLPARSASALGEAGSLTLVRIEESVSSVAYRAEKLRAALAVEGAAAIWPASRSVGVWRAIRDADVLAAAAEDAVWRVSVRPSRGPAVLAAVSAAGGDGYLDWGGGLAMVSGPATEGMHAAVTQAAREAGGVWTLLRAPAPWRAVVPVVPVEAPALAAITRRVKTAMDPAGILNPGRIFAGV